MYGMPNRSSLDVITELRRMEGILLDPLDTGGTRAGVLHYLEISSDTTPRVLCAHRGYPSPLRLLTGEHYGSRKTTGSAKTRGDASPFPRSSNPLYVRSTATLLHAHSAWLTPTKMMSERRVEAPLPIGAPICGANAIPRLSLLNSPPHQCAIERPTQAHPSSTVLYTPMLNCTKVWLKVAAGSLSLPFWLPDEMGIVGTKDWRMYFKSQPQQSIVSAWHDLPLSPTATDDSTVFTFVNEIPRGTRAKMELIKEERHNPIGQDVFTTQTDLTLRFFGYGDMPFNYGFIPRTWESPDHVDHVTGCRGDGDPIDVVLVSPDPVATGSILPVRVLGLLGLIDEGETDWKVITTSVQGGVDSLPEELQRVICDWFVNYKTADGKPKNALAFNGEVKGLDEALRVIAECAEQYRGLISGKDRHSHGYWLPEPVGEE